MRYILSLVLVACLAMPAYAAFKGSGSDGGRGGFSGPVSGAMADTVAAAKGLADDSRVVLTGNIVSQLAGSKDEYMFKDDTGEIQVEISPKVFRGQDITPNDKVRISGKIDKDFGKEIQVEVKVLEKLQEKQ